MIRSRKSQNWRTELKGGKVALVVLGRVWDTESLDEDVQALCRHKDDGQSR